MQEKIDVSRHIMLAICNKLLRKLCNCFIQPSLLHNKVMQQLLFFTACNKVVQQFSFLQQITKLCNSLISLVGAYAIHHRLIKINNRGVNSTIIRMGDLVGGGGGHINEV